MSCFYCKGDIIPSTTVYTVQIDNTVIVIKNVPCEECEQCEQCEQCGEIEISHEVMLKLDHIINIAKQLMQEVAVIDYKSAA